MKQWKHALLSLALVLGMGAVLVPAGTASAINIVEQSCKDNPKQTICKSKGDDAFEIIKTAINVVLFVMGIVAVVMIIIGSFRYVVSAGEAAAVKSAKNTIMYAIVGLVLAILAFTIVNFVVGAF